MSETATCAGKGFEQHQEIDIAEDGGDWSCPACGTTGGYGDFTDYNQRLISLLPLLDKLQEQRLHERAVILVPTDGATGKLGTFMGRDVIRVPGLAEPMIGLPALTWRHALTWLHAAPMVVVPETGI